MAAAPDPSFILRGHESCIHCVTFAQQDDGELLVSADESGEVKIWSLDDRRTKLSFSTSENTVLAIKAWRNLIFTQSKNGYLGLWDWSHTTRAPLTGIETDLHSFCKFAVLTFSDDSTPCLARPVVIASPGNGGSDVGIWDTRSNEYSISFSPSESQGHAKTGMCTALSALAPHHLLGAYEDGCVRAWDTRRRLPLAEACLHSEPIFALASAWQPLRSSSAPRSAVCISGGADGTVVHSLATFQTTTPVPAKGDNDADADAPLAALREEARAELGGGAPAGQRGVNCAHVREDGKVAAAACWDGKVRLYACRRPRLLASLRGHAKGVQAVEFSASSHLLASAAEDARIAVWDVYRDHHRQPAGGSGDGEGASGGAGPE